MPSRRLSEPLNARRRVALAALATLVATRATGAQPADVRVPMVCSRGPDDQAFTATVHMPRTSARGTTFTVRVDSRPSGRIAHFGLYAIFNMTTDLRLGPGARYVEGSARLVPGSGTRNVASSARVWHDDAGIHLGLPARVENGGSYTPPSFTFDVVVDAAEAAGAAVAVRFVHYHVDADVFLLGRIRTTCEPRRGPATIGLTRVEPAVTAEARP
jgi:hypothetical protein